MDYVQNKKFATIINIILLVFSVFMLVCSVIAFFVIISGIEMSKDPDVATEIMNNTDLEYGVLFQDGILTIGQSQAEASALLTSGLQLFLIFAVISVLANLFTLATNIITLFSTQTERLFKVSFTMSIVSAVVSVLTLRIVSGALFIAESVFLHKLWITKDTHNLIIP